MSNKNEIQIWTDGAFTRKYGNMGSWAFCLFVPALDEIVYRANGILEDSTSQRAELTAALMGMQHISDNFSPDVIQKTKVSLHSDSSYLVRGVNEWMHGWKKRGWVKAGEPMKNVDLWKQIYQLVIKDLNKPQFYWVKGHAGIELNEYVDGLCTQILDERKQQYYA